MARICCIGGGEERGRISRYGVFGGIEGGKVIGRGYIKFIGYDEQ